MQSISLKDATDLLQKANFIKIGGFDLKLLHPEHDDYYFIYQNQLGLTAILIRHPCDVVNCTLLMEVTAINHVFIPIKNKEKTDDYGKN